MQKRLTLIRHAKSSWKDESVTDYERGLNNRGERDAPMIGQRLFARDARPSLILTSTAKRARRTATLIARAIGYPVEFIQGEQELYLAEPEQMFHVIHRQDISFNDIILVGHNPGITELANELTNLRIDNVPTCGIVAMTATLKDWTELRPAACSLEYFDYPKKRGESDAD